MQIGYDEGHAGVSIKMTGDELATAVRVWLYSQDVFIQGPNTVRVNDELCRNAEIYVDPCGGVMFKGTPFSGLSES